MVQKNIPARQSFNTLHQSKSLIFQFLIAEFINASLQMDLIMEKLPETHRGIMKGIQNSLQTLSGSLQDYMRFISWNLEEGILPKLKCHAALFASNAETMHGKPLQLEKYSNQAWKLGLESLEMVRLIQEQKNDLLLHESFCQRLNLLATLFKKIGKLLSELILEFSLDENVLFFILRSKEKIEQIYGSGFVRKLFLKMYPNGISSAEEYIKKQYSDRGFNHLLSEIGLKFNDLTIRELR